MSELFKEMHQATKAKKRANVTWAINHLTKLGIKFQTANNGYHLIMEKDGDLIHFWPGTGKYKYAGVFGRGIMNLVGRLK